VRPGHAPSPNSHNVQPRLIVTAGTGKHRRAAPLIARHQAGRSAGLPQLRPLRRESRQLIPAAQISPFWRKPSQFKHGFYHRAGVRLAAGLWPAGLQAATGEFAH